MRWRGFAWVMWALMAAMFVAPVAPAAAVRAVAEESASARQLWVRTFDKVEYDESVVDLGVSPGGGSVFVTGSSYGDLVTIAYDASTGARRWTRRYGPSGVGATPTDLRVSPDGATVFVTGTSNGDFLTIAYRATTGERVWLARHGGTGEGTDVAYALDVTPDGTTVFVTGNSQTRPYSFESSDYLTVAYRADTGAKVWTRRFDGPNHLDDIAYSVAANPDGSSVFVAGTSRAWQQFHDSCQCYTWAYDYVTLAYDAETGDVAWARRRAHDDGSELVEPTRPVLAADTEGSRLFLTTTKFRVETGVDVATYAYDTATGRKLWGTRSAGPGIAEDTSESLIVSPDGATVVVVGATWDAGRSDFLTIAYRAASGMERWRRAYDGPDGLSDGARAVVVDPDGSTVFVTGGSQWGAPRPQGSDFATVAYAVASGAQRWVARYRPRDPADGYLGTTAEAIGVDPGGSAVFVTGTSTAPSFVGADFATVAYRGG